MIGSDSHTTRNGLSRYIGRNTRNILSLGKKIRIKVAKVDDARFFVDFKSVKL